MDPQPPALQFWQLLLYPVFASFGGLLGYALRAMDTGGKVSRTRAALESLASGFVGVLILLLCQAMKLSPQWTGFIVGVCGWLGAAASIRMLEGVVRKRLGLSEREGLADGQP